MRLKIRCYIIMAIVVSSGIRASVPPAGAVSCNLVPLEGTGALSDQSAPPAWRIKPELRSTRDLPLFAPSASPQLYQFGCSDNPKGKPQSGVAPKIPILQLDKK